MMRLYCTYIKVMRIMLLSLMVLLYFDVDDSCSVGTAQSNLNVSSPIGSILGPKGYQVWWCKKSYPFQNFEKKRENKDAIWCKKNQTHKYMNMSSFFNHVFPSAYATSYFKCKKGRSQKWARLNR